MRKFAIRLVLFLGFPAIIATIIIILYIKRDPYLDFGHYMNYSWKYNFQILGDISTKKLVASHEKYNSFIFGSSRTVSLYACYLQSKIEDSRFFHYANWNESIGGINEKLRLLDSLGYNIDNAVICFDTDYTFEDDGKCRPYDHYLLTKMKKSSYLYNHFQKMVLTLDKDKIKILFGYKVKGEVFPDWESDIITNDHQHVCSDSIVVKYGIEELGNEHIRKIDSLKRNGILYKRSNYQQYREKQISLYEEDLLVKIKSMLDKHNTNYYILITPLYDQLKFNTADSQIIRKIFNKNVYDFSGINEYTNNENNYPDGKHFMNYVSREMIDSIVGNRETIQ